jgi:hypothetical protein
LRTAFSVNPRKEYRLIRRSGLVYPGARVLL